MHKLANQSSPINVTHRFRDNLIRGLNLSVVEFYSFPFNTPGVSRIIEPPEWAFEYHYGYAGKMNFLNPGNKFSMKREERMVHLYAPGCLFKEDTRKSVIPRQETYMRFKGGELCGLQKFSGSSRFCRYFDREGIIGDMLEEAALLCSAQGEGAFWEIQSLLLKCISVFLKASSKASKNTFEITSSEPQEHSFVENVESCIRKNIHRTVVNSELARHMNLSESAFNHLFKQKTGISPRSRVIEIKIDTAKSLLLKGKRLKEIAELTGFYDEFHLSRTFRKFAGEPPSKYRRRAGRA